MIKNVLIWMHLNMYFILIMAEIQACKGHKRLKGRVDKVIRQCRLIGDLLRLN